MQNVLTCAQMRAADKYTIEELGVPSSVLMERAGAAIAGEAEKELVRMGGSRVLAVCGGGRGFLDGAGRRWRRLPSPSGSLSPLSVSPPCGRLASSSCA